VNEFTVPLILSFEEKGITTGKLLVELYRDMFYYIRSFFLYNNYFLGGIRPCLRSSLRIIAVLCLVAFFFVRGLLEKHSLEFNLHTLKP